MANPEHPAVDQGPMKVIKDAEAWNTEYGDGVLKRPRRILFAVSSKDPYIGGDFEEYVIASTHGVISFPLDAGEKDSFDYTFFETQRSSLIGIAPGGQIPRMSVERSPDALDRWLVRIHRDETEDPIALRHVDDPSLVLPASTDPLQLPNQFHIAVLGRGYKSGYLPIEAVTMCNPFIGTLPSGEIVNQALIQA